jgi:hypothetical protein
MEQPFAPHPDPTAPVSFSDLDAIVHEVGATYPMLAYVAIADDQPEDEVLEPLIFAGLVSP